MCGPPGSVGGGIARPGKEFANVTPNAVNSLFRHLHSVKGASGYLDHDAVHCLSHAAESVLLRNPKETVSTVAIEQELAGMLRSATPAEPVTATPQRRIRPLVVEDEFTSRAILTGYLQQFGECHTAVKGQEAYAAYGRAIAAGRPYDLVCMDILMPIVDGTEAVRMICDLEAAQGVRSTQGVKILMVTGVSALQSIFQASGDLSVR